MEDYYKCFVCKIGLILREMLRHYALNQYYYAVQETVKD